MDSAAAIPPAVPEVALIPEGWFRMGSDRGRANEAPAHDVRVDAFALALRPVTRLEYQSFLDASGRPPPRSWGDERFADPQQPAVAVSWFDAVAYCGWLSAELDAAFRLPTEAEREKASRGGMEDREYPWGDGPPGWMDPRYRGDDVERPDRVGRDPPNGYGLHNMGGPRPRVVLGLVRRGILRRLPGPQPARPGRRPAARLPGRLLAARRQGHPLRPPLGDPARPAADRLRFPRRPGCG